MRSPHRQRSVFLPFFALLALNLMGLGAATFAAEPAPAPNPAPPPSGSRIVDGTNVPTSQFPTVGEVGDTSGTFCTGTLISPRHVLSAAHCVTDNNGAINLGKTDGRFKLGGQTYATSDIIVHPSYNGQIDQEGVVDLAILVLAQPVVGVTPTPIYRKAPAVGQLLTIAGYGLVGTGAGGVNDGSPVPNPGTIDFGTTPIDEATATFVKWNFDNVAGPGKESNTAPGDSGGPAFITENSILYLAGVTSGGSLDNAGFGDHSFDTRVDANAAWIDSIAGTSTGPTLSIGAKAASEAGPEDGIFTITRGGGDNSAALTVNFAVSGTASAGADYGALGTSIDIPAGAASVALHVTPVADAVAEGVETVVVTLAAPSGYMLGTGSATLKILETPLVKISSGPLANPNPAAVREPVTFSCAANLAGAMIAWNFGDGGSGSGGSIAHTYSAVGTYMVTVTATDIGGDSSDTKTLSLPVNGFLSPVDANVSRVRATLNFRNPDSSRLEFRVASGDFTYPDRPTFLEEAPGSLEVFLGQERIDRVELFNGRGFGEGKATWNYRKGEISYRLRSPALESLLAAYGAANEDTATTLRLPLRIKVGKNAYGGDATLGYKARADRSGIAK